MEIETIHKRERNIIKFIENFGTLENISEKIHNLEKKGYEFYTPTKNSLEFFNTYIIRTPSSKELSLNFLENFIYDTRLEFGNKEHIENLKALEFGTLKRYFNSCEPFIELSF